MIYKKIILSVLLFFVSLPSFNFVALGSYPLICQDEGEADPIRVHKIKITGIGEANIQQWIEQIKEHENINDESQAKGVLGEIVAQSLFETQGYQIIENRAKKLIGCTITTKASAKGEGIDGIFLKKNWVPIFNEAKFRSIGCHKSDLPCTSYGHEASILWYSYHFSHLRDNDMTQSPPCIGLNFKALEADFYSRNILRTMTCLNKRGEIALYYIKDKIEEKNTETIEFLKSFSDLNPSAIIAKL